MVHVDMNQPGADLRPGIDLWVVREATSKESRRGDAMINLRLARVRGGTGTLYDNIMLEGNGWGIGKSKLGAFLPPDFSGDLDPLDFVGRRLWAETVVKTGERGDKLEVNIKGLKHGGYQPAEDVPPGESLPDDDGDTPF